MHVCVCRRVIYAHVWFMLHFSYKKPFNARIYLSFKIHKIAFYSLKWLLSIKTQPMAKNETLFSLLFTHSLSSEQLQLIHSPTFNKQMRYTAVSLTKNDQIKQPNSVKFSVCTMLKWIFKWLVHQSIVTDRCANDYYLTLSIINNFCLITFHFNLVQSIQKR